MQVLEETWFWSVLSTVCPGFVIQQAGWRREKNGQYGKKSSKYRRLLIWSSNCIAVTKVWGSEHWACLKCHLYCIKSGNWFCLRHHWHLTSVLSLNIANKKDVSSWYYIDRIVLTHLFKAGCSTWADSKDRVRKWIPQYEGQQPLRTHYWNPSFGTMHVFIKLRPSLS